MVSKRHQARSRVQRECENNAYITDRLLKLREIFNKASEGKTKLSVNDFSMSQSSPFHPYPSRSSTRPFFPPLQFFNPITILRDTGLWRCIKPDIMPLLITPRPLDMSLTTSRQGRFARSRRCSRCQLCLDG